MAGEHLTEHTSTPSIPCLLVRTCGSLKYHPFFQQCHIFSVTSTLIWFHLQLLNFTSITQLHQATDYHPCLQHHMNLIFALLFFKWQFFCPKWSHFSLPEHTPKLTKLGIYLLSSSISTTRWSYNQGKCIWAYNSLSHIQKPYIHTFTELCWISSYRPATVFSRHKPTFSNSSQTISLISTKLCTQHP